jgi:hypothetical protein
MFNPFTSRPRNRRRDGDFTLDVRLNADAEADGPPRRRRVWWLKPALLLVLAGVAWLGGGALIREAKERWLHHIPSLALKDLPVARDGVITAAEIRRLAGIAVGRNILTVDPYSVRQQLLRHPRIEDARLELEFPDTLRITVRERVPVARLMLPPVAGKETYLLVDDLGHVMAPFEAGRAPAEVIEGEAMLPLLTGASAVGIAPGHTLPGGHTLAALRLLATFGEAAISTEADIAAVDVAVPGLLTVVTTRGAQITMTPGNFERQFQQWHGVQRRSAELRRAIGSLDLSVANHPPLRWVEPASSSTNEPPSRPVRPKRKPPQRRHA